MRGDYKLTKTTEEFIVSKVKEAFNTKNIDIFKQIIATENYDLIDTLAPQKLDSKYHIYAISVLFDDENTKPLMRLILDCCIKVYGRLDFYNFFLYQLENPEKYDFLSEYEKALIYYFYVANSSYDFGKNFRKAKNYDLSHFEQIYKEINFTSTPIEYEITLLVLMIDDEDLCKKYHIKHKLEKLIYKIISTYKDKKSVNISKEEYKICEARAETYKNFDLLKDDCNNLVEIFKHLPFGIFTDGFAFYVLGKLDKFAFLSFYPLIFDFEIHYRYTFWNSHADENIQENIHSFINRYTNHKFPLYLALHKFLADSYFDKLYSYKGMINLLKSIDEVEDLVIFFSGESDDCNFNLDNHFMKDNNRSLLYNMCNFFLKFNEKNQELYQRFSMYHPLLITDPKCDFYEKFMSLAQNISKFNCSVEHLNFLANRVNYFISTELRKDIKNFQFDSDLVLALIKVFSSNADYIKYSLDNFIELEVINKAIILLSINQNFDIYKDAFLNLNEISKQLINVISHLYKQNSTIVDVQLNLLKSSKIKERQFAFAIITTAYPNLYIDELNTLLDVEKNDKFKSEIQTYLRDCKITKTIETTSLDTTNSINKVVADLMQKQAEIEFLSKAKLPIIIDNSGVEVDIKVVKASLIVFQYSVETADSIVAHFDKDSFTEYAKNLLNFYLELAINTRQHWVFNYVSRYGQEAVLDIYINYIQICCHTKTAKTMFVLIEALPEITSLKNWKKLYQLYQKVKLKVVKDKILDVINIELKKQNLTLEEIVDSFIPTYDFDKQSRLTINYGSRKFYAHLGVNLDFELTDETGKIYKNLPKCNKNDDVETAQKNINYYKQVKLEVKENYKEQLKRWNYEAQFRRQWSGKYFYKTMIENPIMRIFAHSIIWGVVKDNESYSETFRYLEDGTFTTSNDEEFLLEDIMVIEFAKRYKLDENTIALWEQHLQDYEVKQPLVQIQTHI